MVGEIIQFRHPLFLNDSCTLGPVAVAVGVVVYVGLLDPWFRFVLIGAGLDRYLTKWSILRVVCKIVEVAARNLSASFTVRASPLGSATEEDAQELELRVEVRKFPPPYSVSGAFHTAMLSS